MAIYAEDMMVDKKEQLRKVEDICLPNEVIRAVFDLKGRGTGFIGITDKRIIFFDREFIKGKKAMVSMPYKSIACVASEDKKGFLIRSGFMVGDKIIITPLGLDDKEFEFRGGDKANLAQRMIMEHLLV